MNKIKTVFHLIFVKKHYSLIILFVIALFARGDSPIQKRLSTLKSAIPLTYNDATQYYIDWYINNPDSTSKILELYKIYSPVMENIFAQYNLPKELAYFSFALSNMNYNSAHKGAGGFWLMLFDDAKNKYKLHINSMVDERREIKRSTVAAAQYFKDLMMLYNDWYLAMTAFRTTPNQLNKAIINAGVNLNYWNIYPFLDYEYREIVPRFVAAAYIINFHNLHNISITLSNFSLNCDSVIVDQQVSFDQISQVLHIPMQELQFLNPEYKSGIIPHSLKKYILRLPIGKGVIFTEKKYTIYSYQAPQPLNMLPQISKADSVRENASSNPLARVSYVVKKYETLVQIADYFDCSVSQLKIWNRIRSRSNQIKPGKVIYIWVVQEKKEYYQGINTKNPKEKRAILLSD